jgi:hypothetical protein
LEFCGAPAHAQQNIVFLLRTMAHAPQNVMFLWRMGHGTQQKDDILLRMGWCTTEFQCLWRVFCGALPVRHRIWI